MSGRTQSHSFVMQSVRRAGIVGLLSFSVCASGYSQTILARVGESDLNILTSLPQEPQAQAPAQIPASAPASLSGNVLDATGTPISGARLTLIGPGGSGTQEALSDVHGDFTFEALAPGSYQLSITFATFDPYNSGPLQLASGETRRISPVAMNIASTSSEVDVTVSQNQVATEEVKAAEKQRVLGIIPNFYSSYIWKAAPLTPKLKFSLATRSVTDPLVFMITAGIAGVEQAHNTFPGYGRGPASYGKRYGAAYADNVIGRMIGSAILPSLFHQDPRYFYKGTGSVPSRALYAIGATVITRGDNGRSQPNYSHILGNFAAAGLSNAYRTDGDRSASLTLRNGLIITGSNAAGNLVREFLLRRLTSKGPTYEKGKEITRAKDPAH